MKCSHSKSYLANNVIRALISRSVSSKSGRKSQILPRSTTAIIKRPAVKIKPAENITDRASLRSDENLISENKTKLTQDENPEVRFNDINVQMLSKNLYEHLFGKNKKRFQPKAELIQRCQQSLRHHGMQVDDSPLLPDANFKLPDLQGPDILEHFYNIGYRQSEPYRRQIERLIESNTPQLPKTWIYKPGWHKYLEDGSAIPVPFPPDDALVFDVEVCMNAGSNPTLACAASDTHWYGWVSETLIDGIVQTPDAVHYGLEELIPLESGPDRHGYDLSDDLLKPKLIVGHNVSYDRARIKEQYWIERTGARFLDTMSMHICVSGVTSYQRTILKSKKEIDPDDESWVQISSLNSLAEVHKLYCGTAISKESRNIFVEGNLKDVQDNFQMLMAYCAGDVIATTSVLKVLFPLFQERFPHPVTLAGMLELGTAYLPVNSNWPEYINSADLTYADIELESKFFLSKKADKACRLMHDQQYAKDLWMWDLDWSVQKLKLKKEKKKTSKDIQKELSDPDRKDRITFDKLEPINSTDIKDQPIFGTFDHKGFFTLSKLKDLYKNLEAKFFQSDLENNARVKCVSPDDELVDPLEEKFAHLYEKSNLLPVRRPLLPGYPAWYRKLCTKPSDGEDWVPGPHNISTSMQVTPKLLSLSWEGYPLHFIRGQGWGFLVPFQDSRPEYEHAEGDEASIVPFESLLEKCPVIDRKGIGANAAQSQGVLGTLWKDVEGAVGKREYYAKNKKDKTDGAYSGTGVWSGVTLAGCCCFLRLPHKDGAKYHVGNPLAKDFINKFSENVLTGAGEEAEKVLASARMLSYWRNNRDRIKQQKVMWLSDDDLPAHLRSKDKKFGAILPQVVVCGTLTRRAMEPTWMTASNAHIERIGSELRAMVQSPPGYNFVGADVDSQELWIAAILGDSQFGLHGATPFGWMTLAGSKAAGTDMHSHTARAASITRDHAKVINYARIYGAGQNFAERLLKQFNPSMSDGDAKSKSRKMFTTTKGKRFYRLKSKYIERVFGDVPPYDDELVMFNFYAQKVAKLNGMEVEEMFEKPKWCGGTESAMFNQLEEIAGSEIPRTPFLGCRLTRALMSDDNLRKRQLPTAVNWVVQSGAVDFLHLMLVNMAWLTGSKARFCLSFHDEVRYLVPEKYKYETALALHITNLYTRTFCAKMLGFQDLPQSVAFFSSVDVDTSLRKEANLDCVTPSNPHGLARGYEVPLGESLDILKTLEKCNGSLGELFQKMSKTTKMKYVLDEVLVRELKVPTENQSIVKIIASKGNNLHEVESGAGDRFLMSMPPKFRKSVWVKRGDFVLVEPIDEGDKVRAEMVAVLTSEHIRFLQRAEVWPERFPTDRRVVVDDPNVDEGLDSDDSSGSEGLARNTNRPRASRPSSSDSQVDESD